MLALRAADKFQRLSSFDVCLFLWCLFVPLMFVSGISHSQLLCTGVPETSSRNFCSVWRPLSAWDAIELNGQRTCPRHTWKLGLRCREKTSGSIAHAVTCSYSSALLHAQHIFACVWFRRYVSVAWSWRPTSARWWCMCSRRIKWRSLKPAPPWISRYYNIHVLYQWHN